MMQAVGLQTYIWNNNLRSAVLLAGFPVLLALMIFAGELVLMGAGALPSAGSLGGDLAGAGRMLIQAAPIAIVVALAWFAVAYLFNQVIIDLATGARSVTRADQPALYNLLENLCISRGLRMPALRLIDSPAMNAFASGLHEGRFVVTVTRGLLEALDEDELEAVLAHELTHIINRDVRTMVIAAIFAGIITLIAELVFRSLNFMGGGRSRGGRSSKGGGLLILIALAIAAVGYLLAIVIRMTLSRSREFVADAGSVQLTKNPDAMISALRKISGHAHLAAPDSVRGLFIDNPEEGPMALFATHPPIAKRIAALERYAGGRVVDEPTAEVSGPWGPHAP